jgi:elongator complex protein 3
MREIPPEFLVAGTERIDLRKDIEAEIKKRNLKISEIRFREIGFKLRDKKKSEKISRKLKLKEANYKASDGQEHFLQFINTQNILFGLLRLRINKDNSAFVRELHVYGKSTEIGLKGNIQHQGLGKKLMKEAENITKQAGIKKLSVISGVGVREYYRKLGYKFQDNYMVKYF